ncbi:protein of unknown function [Methylocaldum szegediense]|uniref:Uncharacterized protein n=1 Tax=Methylocaldum szegediense TaxID=73780 RepID=A0ABN8X8V9_9GAMM|nr:protein of unknown function [Methylocaldum szegediense]
MYYHCLWSGTENDGVDVLPPHKPKPHGLLTSIVEGTTSKHAEILDEPGSPCCTEASAETFGITKTKHLMGKTYASTTRDYVPRSSSFRRR